MNVGDEGLKVPMSSFKKVMLSVALVGVALAIFFGVSKFNDSPSSSKASVSNAPADAENSARQLSCVNVRAKYAALTCEQKATSMPTKVEHLDIPHYHRFSIYYGLELLAFAQDLYNNQPKDLQASASNALQACMSSCPRFDQSCQRDLSEYFGVTNSFHTKLGSFLSEKKRDPRRNQSLVIALGEDLYNSAAGELINRHTDIKICGELKAEAKKDQCDLSATL